MIYLDDENIKNLNQNWAHNVDVIKTAIQCIGEKDIVQPVKPYLRYRDLKNRIIAMPAFVGGNINRSGIKWIASFPDNIQKGIARAHSVIVLNEAETGMPLGVINSGAISAIRTASVSGFMIDQFLSQRKTQNLRLGITGFGPIGQHHLQMCSALFGEQIDRVLIYDLNKINTDLIDEKIKNKVVEVSSWEEAYADADIFITCTVSKDRYINKKPKQGSLHLNVSLRDYKEDVYPWFKNAMVVDDWEEVCRENTDVEMFHKTNGLKESDVVPIQELLSNDYLASLDTDQPIMFNPMGMAAFDIAMANHYVDLAHQRNAGVQL